MSLLLQHATGIPQAGPGIESTLDQAQTLEELCDAWLKLLCEDLLHAAAGALLLAQPDGSYAPAASLPAGRDVSHLADIATDALRQRESIARHDDTGRAQLAYPLQSQGGLQGAVALDLGRTGEAALERALRLTQWGAGWLLDAMSRRDLATVGQQHVQGGRLLDSVLALLAERSLREAGYGLVNRLGREFDCRQVLLGLTRGPSVRVIAMSHAASFDERAEAVTAAAQAMHEACDSRQRSSWPLPQGAPSSDAHRRYAESLGGIALCSVPLIAGSTVVGALLLERERAFEPDEMELLDTFALALAPVLELRREAEQVFRRAARQVRRGLGVATDGSFPAVKLAAVGLAVVLLLLALVPAPFRVSAQASVEGAVQRSAVAPFEGYLLEAPARAGDQVKTGQVLALLDDKDLKLERARWESELEVAQRKEREAMAKANRVDQRLAAAQANQARAQLDLVLSKLERVQVTAPFDAVVVKGDLSQLVGSPLEQGKVLFELAPLDSWRVILKVDERDIGHVALGAKGELVLASLPGTAWPFTVRKLTPVSVAEDGRNFFRVEAQLGEQAPKLSPNMEGVAKVNAGRRSLLWIWTHPLIDWARLAWWKAMP